MYNLYEWTYSQYCNKIDIKMNVKKHMKTYFKYSFLHSSYLLFWVL